MKWRYKQRWFAWRPVRLAFFEDYWHVTWRLAWFRWLEVTDVPVWGKTYYCEIGGDGT
jgi:hypothetical protein